jgi:hypothetical protein
VRAQVTSLDTRLITRDSCFIPLLPTLITGAGRSRLECLDRETEQNLEELLTSGQITTLWYTIVRNESGLEVAP